MKIGIKLSIHSAPRGAEWLARGGKALGLAEQEAIQAPKGRRVVDSTSMTRRPLG